MRWRCHNPSTRVSRRSVDNRRRDRVRNRVLPLLPSLFRGYALLLGPFNGSKRSRSLNRISRDILFLCRGMAKVSIFSSILYSSNSISWTVSSMRSLARLMARWLLSGRHEFSRLLFLSRRRTPTSNPRPAGLPNASQTLICCPEAVLPLVAKPE